MRIEVMQVRPCHDCTGTGKRYAGGVVVIGTCDSCSGTGETRTVVSCKGCVNRNTTGPFCYEIGDDVPDDWACASWQPKETA